MNKLFEATIMWLDTEDRAHGCLFKEGDIDDDDDNIFFYIDSEKEMEHLKKEGSNDFIVIDYHELNTK